MIARILSAIIIFGAAGAAQADGLSYLSTYKCVTDDAEPGMFIQFTYASTPAGDLVVTDLRSFFEFIDGEIGYPTTYSNTSMSLRGIEFNFRGHLKTGTTRKSVNLKVSRIETPIKWPLMAGSVIFNSTDEVSTVTCAYIGVKSPY